MEKLKEIDLIAAVEQTCREESFGFDGLLWQHVNDDASAVIHHGGLTPRIAYILNRPVSTVRRRLVALHKAGKMVRHGRATTTYRWWPVGLYDRCVAEKQQVSQPAN